MRPRRASTCARSAGVRLAGTPARSFGRAIAASTRRHRGASHPVPFARAPRARPSLATGIAVTGALQQAIRVAARNLHAV